VGFNTDNDGGPAPRVRASCMVTRRGQPPATEEGARHIALPLETFAG